MRQGSGRYPPLPLSRWFSLCSTTGQFLKALQAEGGEFCKDAICGATPPLPPFRVAKGRGAASESSRGIERRGRNAEQEGRQTTAGLPCPILLRTSGKVVMNGHGRGRGICPNEWPVVAGPFTIGLFITGLDR